MESKTGRSLLPISCILAADILRRSPKTSRRLFRRASSDVGGSSYQRLSLNSLPISLPAHPGWLAKLRRLLMLLLAGPRLAVEGYPSLQSLLRALCILGSHLRHLACNWRPLRFSGIAVVDLKQGPLLGTVQTTALPGLRLVVSGRSVRGTIWVPLLIHGSQLAHWGTKDWPDRLPDSLEILRQGSMI